MLSIVRPRRGAGSECRIALLCQVGVCPLVVIALAVALTVQGCATEWALPAKRADGAWRSAYSAAQRMDVVAFSARMCVSSQVLSANASQGTVLATSKVLLLGCRPSSRPFSDRLSSQMLDPTGRLVAALVGCRQRLPDRSVLRGFARCGLTRLACLHHASGSCALDGLCFRVAVRRSVEWMQQMLDANVAVDETCCSSLQLIRRLL